MPATRKIGLGIAAALTCMLARAPLHAQELSGNCPIGAKVADRQGKTGTVLDADGSGCHVQFADGTRQYYLAWMLHLAGNPIVAPKDIAAIKPGRYTCYGNGHYLFMDINIRDASVYTDVDGKPGRYAYDPKTQKITFMSGTFQGSYAKYLGKEGIGLASTPTTTFWATLCDLEK